MFKTEFILGEDKKINTMLDLDPSLFLRLILAFFIGRASIMDKLSPFSVAFIAAYGISGRFNILIFLSTMIGMFTFQGLAGAEYLLALGLILISYNLYKKKTKVTLLKSAWLVAIVFTLTRLTILLIFRKILIYSVFLTMFEGITVFTLSYMFAYSLSTESLNKVYTNEKIICSFITLALLISGIGDLTLLGLSIKNIINIILILYFAYAEGGLMGGTVGILLGLTSYISQTEMPFILSIYALAGLLAGVFRELGKAGSILGFIVGSSIVSFYINGYIVSFITIKELLISLTVFYLSYNSLNQLISNYMDKNLRRDKKEIYFKRKEELIVDRLNSISSLFRDLGKTFHNSSKMDLSISPEESYQLIDRVGNCVCATCAMRRFCWEESFYTTYQALYQMLALLEKQGHLKEGELPASIRDYCINKDDLIGEMERNFSNFKTNNMWKKKLLESRKLLSHQLEEVGGIVEKTINNIYKEPIFKEDVEEIIFANLRNHRIDVEEVVVIELEDKDFEIYVEVGKAYKESNQGDNVGKIVAESINIPLKLCPNLGRTREGREKYKFIKRNRYSALTSVISQPNSQNEVSGDNYTFGEGENDYYIALSDGMGTGSKAYGESSIALNLLESFLQANFDKGLALKTINSVLRLKSNEELFTTLDISLLDLCTGRLQIIKSGSPATFIKRKGEVRMINPNSLPVGILKEVDFNIHEEYVEDGDIIIMMSDGIIESNESIINKERWMRKVIQGIDSLNPETIANIILETARAKSEGKDDKTILVTKIWRSV